MKKKLVIFDMDGLLLDTERVTDLCWQKTFKELEIDFSEEDRHHLIGIGYDAAQKIFEKRFGDSDVFWELRKHREGVFAEYFAEHGIDVKAGVLDLIKILKENKINIAVASSTLKERGEYLLKTTKIYDLFDYFIYGDMVEETKPNPAIFLNVVDHFKVDIEETLILEDSYYGVKAANNAKIDVIWIKDMVDIDEKGVVHYQHKFNSITDAIPTIEKLI